MLFDCCIAKTKTKGKNKKFHDKSCECENCLSMECLLEKLKNQDWKNNPENVFLEIAYDNKIIKDIVTSSSQLNSEDKKNLEEILALYYLKYEFC